MFNQIAKKEKWWRQKAPVTVAAATTATTIK